MWWALRFISPSQDLEPISGLTSEHKAEYGRQKAQDENAELHCQLSSMMVSIVRTLEFAAAHGDQSAP